MFVVSVVALTPRHRRRGPDLKTCRRQLGLRSTGIIQALPPDQPTVQTVSGSVRELHSTNLGAAAGAGQSRFFVATQGARAGREEGVLHVTPVTVQLDSES
jgi:hypothetical protein